LGFAHVDHAAHGALRLGAEARGVLKGERQVAMRRAVARPRTAPRNRGPQVGDVSAADEALFDRLKAWRLAEARAQAVPAFVILHDRTLAAIARERPPDIMALAGISGIGARKLERYGAVLLGLVAA
jgi:ATP-dependent DNA helicase RecQ